MRQWWKRFVAFIGRLLRWDSQKSPDPVGSGSPQESSFPPEDPVLPVQPDSQEEGCDHIPHEFADAEDIGRAICTPFHLNSKNKLKKEAFLPPYDSDELSAMRASHMSVDECRRRGQALNDEEKTYQGIAFAPFGKVVACKTRVVDSRDVWCGHADIHLPHIRARKKPGVPGEPAAENGAEAAENSQVANALKNLFVYLHDSELKKRWRDR